MTDLDGVRVLIVDDEPFMRRTIRAMLRAFGRFVVTEADDGDVALLMIGRVKPDVVLCDISMPRMGGLRFVELLRERSGMHDMPVIMLTGHAEEATVGRETHQCPPFMPMRSVSPRVRQGRCAIDRSVASVKRA